MSNDSLRQPVLSVHDIANLFYRIMFPEGMPSDQQPPNYDIAFKINDGYTDAFNRIRISNPYTVFDSKQLVDDQSLFWSDMLINGTGTSSVYNTGSASTSIVTTNAVAGTRVRQTKRRFNYQPGKSFLVSMTGVLAPDAVYSGTLRQIGYFDNDNGLFFQLSGTQLSVGVRTSTSGVPVDTVYNQNIWNIDKLDGSGKSEITLNPTKSQIFLLDFQWLGVGKIRFGFEIDGRLIYCHEITNANILDKVYMSTPNLPLRYLIRNYGTGPSARLTHICASVISEGGIENNGIQRAIDRGTTLFATANNSNLYPLIAVRLKSNYLAATIRMTNLSILCTTTSAFRWSLVLNPTISGPAFSFSPYDNSALEFDMSKINTTTLVTGTGIIIASGYSNQNSGSSGQLDASLPNDLILGADAINNRDIIVLAVQRLSGVAEDFYASIGYRETV